MSNITNIEANPTSSIGAAWPPAGSPCERLRGIYTEGVIETAAESAAFAETYQGYREALEDFGEASRLSIRFVAHAAGLRALAASGVNLEAAIPIADETGMWVAYAGNNLPDRSLSPDRLARHDDRLRQVVTRPALGGAGQAADLERAGYTSHVLDGALGLVERGSMIAKFLAMYRIFGYDAADVDALLASDANTIVYLEHDGKIVSTAMAERATVPVSGFGDLTLVEITEASTLPAYRQRGLYKAASGILTDRLVERQADDPVHAVYGESNLAMPGVLIAAHENGRRFSLFDRSRLGIPGAAFGILPQNFRVEDGIEDRPYNDFAVSYVPLATAGGDR